jgi:hypothetical protein
MVDGFAAPCMLGAMGIIFIAFLAPSGNDQRKRLSVFLPHRARVLCLQLAFFLCFSLVLVACADIICFGGYRHIRDRKLSERAVRQGKKWSIWCR